MENRYEDPGNICADRIGDDSEIMGVRRFLIDTDTGSDDAWAIVEALCATDIAHVEAITTLCGNFPLDLCTRNALLAEDAAGTYFPPVFRGMEHPLLSKKSFAAYNVHGEDGLGGLNLSAPERKPEEKHAVMEIIDLVRENPGEIEIITIGPLTNIAVAFTLAPDLARKIKKLWILGGSAGIRGNLTEYAEYNVGSDPEAAQIVLQSGAPAIWVTLDTTRGDTEITPDEVDRLLAGSSGAGRFCALATRRLREYYKELRGGGDTYCVVDSLAVTAALYPEIMTNILPARCRVELHEEKKRGYFHFDTETPDLECNALLCTTVDSALFKKRMFALLGIY